MCDHLRSIHMGEVSAYHCTFSVKYSWNIQLLSDRTQSLISLGKYVCSIGQEVNCSVSENFIGYFKELLYVFCCGNGGDNSENWLYSCRLSNKSQLTALAPKFLSPLCNDCKGKVSGKFSSTYICWIGCKFVMWKVPTHSSMQYQKQIISFR